MGQEVKIRLINFNKKRLGGEVIGPQRARIEGFDNRAPAHLGVTNSCPFVSEPM